MDGAQWFVVGGMLGFLVGLPFSSLLRSREVVPFNEVWFVKNFKGEVVTVKAGERADKVKGGTVIRKVALYPQKYEHSDAVYLVNSEVRLCFSGQISYHLKDSELFAEALESRDSPDYSFCLEKNLMSEVVVKAVVEEAKVKPLDELLANLGDVDAGTLKVLQKEAAEWGIAVDSYEIRIRDIQARPLPKKGAQEKA